MSEQSSPPVAELDPANDLEKALAAAQNGESTTAEFLQQLIDANVFVLIGQSEEQSEGQDEGQDEEDQNIQPLVLEGPDKVPMLVMFTGSERTAPLTQEFPDFTFPLEVEFAWLVANSNDGMGIVINPGWSYGASLPPEVLTQLRNKDDTA